MRVLAIHHSYHPLGGAPSTNGQAVAEALVSRGDDVTVLTALPPGHRHLPRRETINGVSVVRVATPKKRKGSLAARGIDGIAFVVSVLWYLVRHLRSHDVVIVSTFPPVILATVVRWLARPGGFRYVYHLQDLNPEAALVSGVMQRSWKTRLLRRLDQSNRHGATCNVVLSEDMAKTLRHDGIPSARIAVANNFIAGGRTRTQLSPELSKAPDKFRILFAGNLGLVQGLENVIEAARRLADPSPVEFVFVGSGAGEGRLRDLAAAAAPGRVSFFPPQPEAVAHEMMRDADVGLVSIMPGIHTAAYPSKTMAYLEANCPLIVIADPSSELATTVSGSGAGLVCRPGSVEDLLEAVEKMLAAGTSGMRPLAATLAETEFSRAAGVASWMDVMDGIRAEAR